MTNPCSAIVVGAPGAIGVAPERGQPLVRGVVMSDATCSIVGCESPVRSRGWCAAHYGRWYRHGDPLIRVRPARGTGRAMTTDGYVQVMAHGHPLADARGRVLEHRKVVHDAGIPIPAGWHVHHLNGVRTDNRLENLEVVDPVSHGREHSHEGHSVRWGYEMPERAS